MTKQKFTTNIEKELLQRIKIKAIEESKNVNEIIEEVLKKYLEEEKEMIEIVSEDKNWYLIIDGIEYNFYYSDAKPIEGLLLDGCDTQKEEYQISNKTITARKEKDIYSKNEYKYILEVKEI